MCSDRRELSLMAHIWQHSQCLLQRFDCFLWIVSSKQFCQDNYFDTLTSSPGLLVTKMDILPLVPILTNGSSNEQTIKQINKLKYVDCFIPRIY